MKRFAPTLASLLAAFSTQAADWVDELAWQRHFDERRVPGTFVLFEPDAHRYRACNESRARTGYLPASTFKIAHALIALETRALADENELFRWDGRPKLRAAWERDHTLASGMRESVVWMFQRIARRIGKARMKEWLARLEYGNADTGGGIDHFWLQGSLRTSAVEQVDFLRRLEEGRLPVGARARRLVREAIFHERVGDAVIRGKTGTVALRRDAVAWWVGWVERGGRPVAFFAMNYRPRPGLPHGARFEIGKAILKDAGLL